VAIAIALTLAVASRSRPGRGLLGGMSGGALVGVLLALLTSIAFGPRVGVAMGVTLGLLAWIAAMAVAAMRREGFDFDAYGRSFKPQQTIDMTKETIEWARRRMPLSRGS
jgi:predicted lipid-binding transport protein (Tim44 family)